MREIFYVGTHGSIDPDLIKRVIIAANNLGLSGKPIRKIYISDESNNRTEIDLEL